MASILRHTLRFGAVAAVVVAILTLTGIFNRFARLEVIADQLTLSLTVLLVALVAAGYLCAYGLLNRRREDTLPTPLVALIGGAVPALMIGLAITAVVLLQQATSLQFMFPNLQPLTRTPILFGQEEVGAGIALLLLVSAGVGAVSGLLVFLPARWRSSLFITLGLVIVVGILQGQLNAIINLPDALAIAAVFAVAYLVGFGLSGRVDSVLVRVGVGVGVGLALTFGLYLLATSPGALENNGFLRPGNRLPQILSLAANGGALLFFIGMTLVGVTGALTSRASATLHNSAWALMVGIMTLGVLSWQREMNLTAFLIIAALMAVTLALLPPVARLTDGRFHTLALPDQNNTRVLFALLMLGVLILVPSFSGQFIANALGWTMVYIIMGIGLNVMVGYSGLLDLGYVAAYAVGAYTAGILTTNNAVTCGAVSPDPGVICAGVTAFWVAVPIAIIVAILSRLLLGMLVLRLRGDYLAIVTLGFGEIIGRLIVFQGFSPVLGGSNGITNIPSPSIGAASISGSLSFYYVFVAAAVISAVLILRLSSTRLGRAWKAIREDEDVAEAAGVNLVWNKLLAFAISSAFAGLAGALFGTYLKNVTPGSFTLSVSINVLSLIIIGGLGSVPGVVVGALILIGLPEALRELQDYRLLAFGVLLVAAMILKPEGLLPPRPPRLSERVEAAERKSSPPGVPIRAPAAGD